MKKLWEIPRDSVKTDENPELILNEYAGRLKTDTEGTFVGVVTETVLEDTGSVMYALYILVPELHDYMYRLIEVTIQNMVTPYPLEVRLFARDPKNHRALFAENVQDYKTKLESLITSPTTQGVLLHLKTLIDLDKVRNK